MWKNGILNYIKEKNADNNYNKVQFRDKFSKHIMNVRVMECIIHKNFTKIYRDVLCKISLCEKTNVYVIMMMHNWLYEFNFLLLKINRVWWVLWYQEFANVLSQNWMKKNKC